MLSEVVLLDIEKTVLQAMLNLALSTAKLLATSLLDRARV